MDKELKAMSLHGGTKILKAGAHTNTNFLQFVAREAVTVSYLELNGDEATLSDWGLDSTELYQTELVAFPDGYTVTAITFSGSISISL
jgi:hypothetical protein